MNAAFCQMLFLMMKSPHYKHYALADLEWLVMPALASGQFHLAEARPKEGPQAGMTVPVGLVMWARVNDEVDQRLTASAGQPFRLKPHEWTSGHIHWLIDAIGDPRVIQPLLKRLCEGQIKGHPLKTWTRGSDGKPVVQQYMP